MSLFGNLFNKVFKGNDSKIDVKATLDNLVNFLKNSYGLDFEGKIEKPNDNSGDYAVLTNSLTAKPYGNADIFCKILVFPNCSFSVEFIFDKLNETSEVIEKLYEFNKHIAFLSAYVNENGYLTVHYNVAHLTEADIEENTRRALNSLTNDIIVKYLQPLNSLTYSN